MLATWRSTVTPVDPGRDQDGVGEGSRRHTGLHPGQDPAVTGRLGHRRRGGRCATELDQRGGQHRLTGHDTGQPPLHLGFGAELGDGRRGGGQRLHHGDQCRGAPGGLGQQSGLEEAEPGPPDILGQGDAQQSGGGQFGPELAVEAVAVALGLQLPQALLGRQVGEDAVGQFADGLLLLAE
ncbi:MAG TPA: hypothetical protein VF279_02050 [Acidimicrobiales bacterium]